jgi:AcrR family transcriptional regulator
MTNLPPPPRQRLLEAAEQLLVAEGADALTTRRVAAEAGVPNGLVHYHLGSVDALLQALAGRVGGRLVAGQRALFDAPISFADRWRAAVLATAGDPTWAAWTQLRAMSLSRPGLRETVAALDAEWREVIGGAIDRSVADYELGPAVAEPLAALAATLLHGMASDHLAGTGNGQDALLRWTDGLLLALGEPVAAGV